MLEIDEPVHLSEYRSSWPEEFARERARLARSLDLPPERFEHIGSTAVPRLLAKPIVDLMLGVEALPEPAAQLDGIEACGYQCLGEAGVPGRLYFRRRQPDFNLHVLKRGDVLWQENLMLREFLCSSAAARERYASAKRRAFATAGTLLAYSDAKAAEVAALLKLARSPP